MTAKVLKHPKVRVQPKAKTSKNRTLKPLDNVISSAHFLTTDDLRSLSDAIAVMLEAREEKLRVQQEAETPEKRTLKTGNRAQRGSYESKRINGCGPYLYLRYWSGGKHRSVYLGKEKSKL